jgi:hypothetical protein
MNSKQERLVHTMLAMEGGGDGEEGSVEGKAMYNEGI